MIWIIFGFVLSFIFSIIPASFIAWVLKGFFDCSKKKETTHTILLFILLVATNLLLCWFLIAIAIEDSIGIAIMYTLFVEFWIFFLLYVMIINDK